MTCPVCKMPRSSITGICSLCQAEKEGRELNVLLLHGKILAYNLNEAGYKLCEPYEMVKMTPQELRSKLKEQADRQK